ncbi:MAG: polysaccharide deacetylase family protein [Candidatus Manganitrophaceae bacterium]
MSRPTHPFASISFKEDRVAWILSLFIILLVFGGGYLWLHRQVLGQVVSEAAARGDSAAPSLDDPRIPVLAYDRIVRDKDDVHLDRNLFREHLETLREAGFTPIRASDLADFYERGTPLPPNRFLLTFDHGYLETYAVVDPLLREMQWRAVMFIKTVRQEKGDTFFLYWDRLQRMIDSGLWEIGSNGRYGNDPVPVDREGTKGPFLTRRIWVEKEGGIETDSEMEKRVVEDYRSSKETIESHLSGIRHLPFGSLFADLSRITDDPQVVRSNDQGLTDFYSLGFVEDRFGINDRTSDPRRLKRLRVDPTWSGKELVYRLTTAMAPPPKKAEWSKKGNDHQKGNPERPGWIEGEGLVSMEGDRLLLEGAPRADLWFPGSTWAEEWMMEADLSVESGGFWLIQESSSGDMWRWGGDGGGKGLSLQYRTQNGLLETIARFPAEAKPGEWHHVKLVKRGKGLWIEWDRHPLSDRPIYLPLPSRGPLGWIAWEADGRAALRLADLRFTRHTGEIRRVGKNPTPEAIAALVKEAPRIAALSPPWMTIRENRKDAVPFEADLFKIFSRRYGWEILPTVRLEEDRRPIPAIAGTPSSSETKMEIALLNDLLERAEKEGWDGIYIDRQALSEAGRKKWEPLLRDWEYAFQKRGLRLAF